MAFTEQDDSPDAVVVLSDGEVADPGDDAAPAVRLVHDGNASEAETILLPTFPIYTLYADTVPIQ